MIFKGESTLLERIIEGNPLGNFNSNERAGEHLQVGYKFNEVGEENMRS